MLYTGFKLDQPAAVRYPRGGGPGVEISQEMQEVPIGKAEYRRQGKGIAILAFGTMVQTAAEAGEELDATVVNMRFVKPVDVEMILEVSASHDLLVTIEENVVQGGAGAAVNETLMDNGISKTVINVGLPDKLLAHGSREDMLEEADLTKAGLLAAIQRHYELNSGVVTNIKTAVSGKAGS